MRTVDRFMELLVQQSLDTDLPDVLLLPYPMIVQVTRQVNLLHLGVDMIKVLRGGEDAVDHSIVLIFLMNKSS